MRFFPIKTLDDGGGENVGELPRPGTGHSQAMASQNKIGVKPRLSDLLKMHFQLDLWSRSIKVAT